MSKRLLKNQRGAALLETAITIPLVLLIAVSIFEFGRAYQTWQILTNAAREGARVAVISENTDAQVTSMVRAYMTNGGLPAAASATVNINRAQPLAATARVDEDRKSTRLNSSHSQISYAVFCLKKKKKKKKKKSTKTKAKNTDRESKKNI